MKFGLLVLLFATFSPFIAYDGAKKGVRNMEGDDLINIWLRSIERASKHGFKPLAALEKLPAAVLGGTRLWSARFSTAEANPAQMRKDVKYSYHLSTGDTPDLIRY